MRASFAFLLLMLLAPRVAPAQSGRVAQAVSVLDLYAGLPFVGAAFERPVLDRAGGGVSGEASAVRPVAAERLGRAPARAPHALPNPDYALFVPEYLLPVLPRVAPEAAASPAAAAVAAPSTPVVSAGAVRARAETVYYEVDGESREDLTAALRRHGPRIEGAQFFGLTEWKVSAEYRPARQAAGCGVEALTVRVMVQTHLPRWAPPEGGSEELSGAWDRFVSALDRHEHGHRALAEEAAEAIRQRLASVRTSTCDGLDPAAQREMAVAMREYESHNLAYDAETGHGRTQGAVWPPQD